MKRYRIYISLLIGLALTLTSCEKDFLDVNVDPNNAASATLDKVLPAAQGFTAYDLGNQFQILGGIWSQYWTQGPTASQYEDLDKYLINNTDYNRPWQDFYAGSLKDYKFVMDEGLKIKNNASLGEGARSKGSNYAAIAKIMLAYNFQVLTDLFGDIPFSEALKGDENVLSPKYDKQEDIYNGIVTLVNDGIALIDEEGEHPGSDDLIYAGDMHLWRKFANTLKLRIYLRQSEIRPNVAQAGIEEMYTNEEEFIDFEEDAQIGFSTETFNKNPLYASIHALGVGNLIGSNTLLNYQNTAEDIRVQAYFVPSAAGTYVGINQGEGKLLPNPGSLSATNYALPSAAVGGMPADDDTRGAEAPVVFISSSESFFLQAEARERGWIQQDPEEAYVNGIIASFERWRTELESLGNDVDEGIDLYLGLPEVDYTSATNKIQTIITQKWVAMASTQNIESWTEFRRTNYPSFLIISKNSKIGNFFPSRILYPDTEQTRNTNFPGQKTVSDKVWWDVN